MKRRFGRGRRRTNERGEAAPIDAAHWMPRILESGAVEAESLEPFEVEGVAENFAVLGLGARPDGRPVAVGFSPTRGADAALAVLALGAQRARQEEPETALFAVAPDWSGADRRRLGLLAPRLPMQALAVSALAGGTVRIASEATAWPAVEPTRLAGRLGRGADAEIFARALAGLEGLAAKHGGALRAVDDRVELVLLAQRTAALVAQSGSLRIEVSQPDSATLPLASGEAVATALDRLEGSLRKLLNDRKLRAGDAGVRAALAPVLERASELRERLRWPLPGLEGECVDWIGVDAQARVVIGASREEIDLSAFAAVLDAAAQASQVASELARTGGVAVMRERPRLALAAQRFDTAVIDAWAAMDLDIALYDARTRRNGEWSLEERPRTQLGEALAPEPEPQPQAQPQREGSRDRGGRRGGRRGRPERDASAASELAQSGPSPAADSGTGEAAAGGMEEVSLFDLDDDGGSESGGGRDNRRRRGRRRRGRRGGRNGEGGSEGGSETRTGAAPESEASGRAPRARPKAQDDDDTSDDDETLADVDDETLAPLAADAPDLEDTEAPGYEDEDSDDEADPEADRVRREREQRRRVRAAKPAEPPPPPRRRAAFLAHADRVSVLTAAVLARDVRLVESFWVYPQDDLMRFFRSVATDLREGTPIFLVGFSASPPARDTIQSASLYAGRLDWFDHHDWPPEDLESLRAALGPEHVHVEPGADSSLAGIISERTRRSRFSDKLVELITGRFSQHDYERWGRWWWHRAGEIAGNHGERRNDVEPLLAGRPSDLARDVAKQEEPPLPPELSYVSERDFRLVHFGGMSMVVLEVPSELDPHLCARIARERYVAQLSLTLFADRELVILGGDDSGRSLDVGGLTAHLATKHAWIDALADDDHVARMRVRNLHGADGRLDELVTEIAMGRSIVEG